MVGCQGVGEEEMGSCCSVGIVSVLQDLISSGDRLHNNVNIRNTTEMYT